MAACKQGIHLETLPTGFRCAIEVSRRLSIDYIWIDALCIIQDDLNNWEIQASTMADIYQNAFLVLAMTRNSTPDQDCRAQELPTMITIGSVQTRLLYHTSPIWGGKPRLFPLMCRAWAFQERILAPRVLHFGPHELSWECFSCRTCECERDREDQGFQLGNMSKRTFFNEIIRKGGNSNIEGLWYRLVEKYSGLALTSQDDTLPALSGIATVMQKVRTGTYLAGLWSDSLVRDMLWSNDGRYNREPLRAPSWSWASGKGSIGFQRTFHDDRTSTSIEADVIDFHCELEGTSSFGKVKSGWIQLKSANIELFSNGDGGPIFTDSERRSKLPQVEMRFKFDGAMQPFQFIMIRMVTVPHAPGLKGYEEMLLVQAVGDDGKHFRRVGYAQRMDPDPPIV
jgi:hypothetical protein